ncbi:MAG TPA: RluA family pseudouridine synthase [Planctomycetota bacterium]|nr:RluA family pseudouridine synthase [Planctomycetota bacterium]
MRTPLTIVFSDEHLLVADKPAGLLTVAGKDEGASLESVLAEQGFPAKAVHRLDRDVSGCVLCAREPSIVARLEDLFRERRLEKIYWALALGRVEPDAGQWKFPLLQEGARARVSARGQPSTTAYKTLARHPLASELEITLVTGRYNQIRVHAAHVGHPLAGERKYARGKDDPFRASRVALHAWRLEFVHPVTGRGVEARAELPPELERLREAAAALQRARKSRTERPGS